MKEVLPERNNGCFLLYLVKYKARSVFYAATISPFSTRRVFIYSRYCNLRAWLEPLPSGSPRGGGRQCLSVPFLYVGGSAGVSYLARCVGALAHSGRCLPVDGAGLPIPLACLTQGAPGCDYQLATVGTGSLRERTRRVGDK